MGAREGFAHWELNPRAIHALCAILYGALFLGNVRGCDDRHSHALNTRVLLFFPLGPLLLGNSSSIRVLFLTSSRRLLVGKCGRA